MKVCFWGEIAEALHGATPGGGELQIALLAKAFASSGDEVVLVDYITKTEFTTPEGIKVVPVPGWEKGIRIIRSFTHRFPWLYKTLRDQHADVYYCRMRDFRHMITYRAARKVKARFVYDLADGYDTVSFIERCKYDYFTKKKGLWWLINLIFSENIHPRLLRKADLVIAQHEGQAESLRKKNVQAVVYHNLIELNHIPVVNNPERSAFIYVGSLAKNKGFDVFYELIVNNPNHFYKIIGQPRDKTGAKYFRQLKDFSNVQLYGRLNHASAINHINNSKALICTSPVEGFPNIFLEAWACGTPVLSLFVDPGNIIQNNNLGFFANGDIDKLYKAMLTIETSEVYSYNARNYVLQNHILNEQKIDEIRHLFHKA